MCYGVVLNGLLHGLLLLFVLLLVSEPFVRDYNAHRESLKRQSSSKDQMKTNSRGCTGPLNITVVYGKNNSDEWDNGMGYIEDSHVGWDRHWAKAHPQTFQFFSLPAYVHDYRSGVVQINETDFRISVQKITQYDLGVCMINVTVSSFGRAYEIWLHFVDN